MTGNKPSADSADEPMDTNVENEASEEEIRKLKSANAQEIHRAVTEEGADELNRPSISLFWSAIAAGVVVTNSLIAEGVLQAGLPDTPWRHLVVAIGYSFGFLIVIMGRMQLFTESTITGMLPFVSKPSMANASKMIRLWSIVIAGNLIGTAIAAAVLTTRLFGQAEHFTMMMDISRVITEPDAMRTFLTAIPAGFLIAVLTWLLPNSRDGSTFWIIFALTWLIGAAGFTHSIVGSAEAFLLLFNGETDIAFTVFGFLLPAILGNLVGGAAIFAMLAHAQVKAQIAKNRRS